MRTRIQTSTLSARKMRDSIVRDYVRDGWKEVDLPPKVAEANGYSACLIRGQDMLILNADHDPETKQSRAIVTVMGGG